MPVPGAYRGRFAPSPTGPLHAGSLVAALGSWLDARAHRGSWLVRIEDIDAPRCEPGADRIILGQLAACGLVADDAPRYQSQRSDAYSQALQNLQAAGAAFACGCTRADIEAYWAGLGRPAMADHELVYPGTCRGGLHGRPARAWRLRVDAAHSRVDWHDRRLGAQSQDVAQGVGDFVLRRADGLWAYQLAVVVDDAAQGITDIVRGEDLAGNTARQICLQRALTSAGAGPDPGGFPRPRYLHLPLVLAPDGRKLSKQNGAQALDLRDPVAALQAAAQVLGLPRIEAASAEDWLALAVPAWAGIIAGFATRRHG